MTTPNVAPKVSLVDQLAKINVKPEQIKYVGISHYHADHTGQVASFPKATLLIGKGEWEAITSPEAAGGVNFKPFENWIKGESKVEPVPLDKDVFGDGSVIMLHTPGHTPGHHSLLVKLPQTGAVVLSGDAMHFRENYDTYGVPAFNSDRAQTVASIERIKRIAANLKATVIIQHDARDVDKLPAFPASAKRHGARHRWSATPATSCGPTRRRRRSIAGYISIVHRHLPAPDQDDHRAAGVLDPGGRHRPHGRRQGGRPHRRQGACGWFIIASLVSLLLGLVLVNLLQPGREPRPAAARRRTPRPTSRPRRSR